MWNRLLQILSLGIITFIIALFTAQICLAEESEDSVGASFKEVGKGVKGVAKSIGKTTKNTARSTFKKGDKSRIKLYFEDVGTVVNDDERTVGAKIKGTAKATGTAAKGMVKGFGEGLQEK